VNEIVVFFFFSREAEHFTGAEKGQQSISLRLGGTDHAIPLTAQARCAVCNYRNSFRTHTPFAQHHTLTYGAHRGRNKQQGSGARTSCGGLSTARDQFLAFPLPVCATRTCLCLSLSLSLQSPNPFTPSSTRNHLRPSLLSVPSLSLSLSLLPAPISHHHHSHHYHQKEKSCRHGVHQL